MKHSLTHALLGTLVALTGLLARAGTADATMKVLESDVAEIKVGSEWADDAKLPIPPGKKVRVLMLPSNVTKVISGPELNSEGTARNAPWGGTRGAEGDE